MRVHIQPDSDSIKLRGYGRVAFHHQRIVSGNNVSWRISQAPQRVVALKRLAEVVHQRKTTSLLHVLVIVAGVRREHHPPAFRVHPDALQARRMTADMMNAYAGRNLGVSPVENDSVPENQAHHPSYMLDFVRTVEA